MDVSITSCTDGPYNELCIQIIIIGMAVYADIRMG